MAIKLGINGFGRIGRTVLRIAAERPEELKFAASTFARLNPNTWFIL